MNMMTICKSIGDILYEKGVFGHVTVDLVSFPDPTSPHAHPLFWAIDLNCHMTDYAASCYFFDFLMVSVYLILTSLNSGGQAKPADGQVHHQQQHGQRARSREYQRWQHVQRRRGRRVWRAEAPEKSQQRHKVLSFK